MNCFNSCTHQLLRFNCKFATKEANNIVEDASTFLLWPFIDILLFDKTEYMLKFE